MAQLVERETAARTLALGERLFATLGSTLGSAELEDAAAAAAGAHEQQQQHQVVYYKKPCEPEGLAV